MQVRLKVNLIAAGQFHRAGSVMELSQVPEFARARAKYYEKVREGENQLPSVATTTPEREGSHPGRLPRR